MFFLVFQILINIIEEERKEAIKLIEEACALGARKWRACEVLTLSIRTLER